MRDGLKKPEAYRKQVGLYIEAREKLETARRKNPHFSIYSHLYLSGEIGIQEVPALYRKALQNYEKHIPLHSRKAD